ncbi:MAG: hypothetical protein U5R46_09720 [Gammaproteobacteria bacterium]|nr:hypothetical protein [Gammaproteobacteria bacterium]
MTASLILVLVSLVMPACLARARDLRPAIVPLILIAVLLNAVSLYNVIEGPLPGAQWDARSFHTEAESALRNGTWPEISIGTGVYTWLLTAVYRITGAELLAGQALSVIAGMAALLAVAAIARNLALTARPYALVVAIAGCGLFPPFVFHSALTFREPFQLATLAWGIHFALAAHRQGEFRKLIPAVACFLFMGMFHHILLALAVVLAVGSVFLVALSGSRQGRRSVYMFAFAGIVLVSGTYLVVKVPATGGNDYVNEIRKKGGILSALDEYRNDIEAREPRTSFGDEIDTTSTGPLATGLARNYFHYQFKPYVTDIELPADLVPFAASTARALCLLVILAAIATWRRDPRIWYLVTVYVVMTFLWSVGTTNYGQAFRHHALTDWMVVLLACHLGSLWRVNRAVVPADPGARD